MNLATFLTMAVAAYALLQFLIIPQVEGRWAAEPSPAKLAKAGVIAVLKTLRTTLQIAIFAFGVLYLMVSALAWAHFATPSAAQYLQLIAFVQNWSDVLSGWGKHLGTATFWLAVIGLACLSYWSNRRAASHDVQRLIDRERKRLEAERAAGQWEKLPPDSTMVSIMAARQSVQRRFDQQLTMLAFGSQDPGELQTVQMDLKKTESELLKLQEQYTQQDFLRRMNLATEPDPRTDAGHFWPSVLRIISSKGVTGDLGRASKWVSRTAAALMFLGLVGASAPAIVQDLNESIATLKDLTIEANHRDAVASWDALGKTDSASPEGESTTVQMRQLARLFVSAYLSSLTPQQAKVEAHQAFILRSGFVRESLLTQAAQASHDRLQVEGGWGGGISRAQRRVVAILEQHQTQTTQPFSALEDWVARRLQAAVEQKPGVILERITAGLKAHIQQYGEPAQTRDLATALLGELLEPVIDSTIPTSSDARLSQASKALRKGVQKAAEQSIEIAYLRLLSQLSTGRSISDALSAVETPGASEATMTRPMLSAVHSALLAESERIQAIQPSSGVSLVQVNPDPVDMKAVSTWYTPRYGLQQRPLDDKALYYNDSLATAITSYEDLFPSSESMFRSTQRVRMLDPWAMLSPEHLGKMASRSRSFEELDKFHAVGGIVIGRTATPPDDHTVNVIDLRWRISGSGRVNLSTQTENGAWHDLGEFSVATMRAALRYAADGRKLAVTIINTEVGAQKVLLHPALVDTPVGCNLIELDKFVFSYIDPGLRASISAADKNDARLDRLYRLSDWAARATRVNDEDRQELEGLIETNTRKLGPELSQGLRAVKSLDTGKDSVLDAEPYDKNLLIVMRVCSQASELDGFLKCIGAGADGVPDTKQQLHAWYEEVPEMHMVSAVRETEFKAEAVIGPLDTPRETPFQPLQFFVQYVFATPLEQTPYAHPLTRFDEPIEAAISQLVSADKNAASVLSEVQSFTILQRLFRLGLDGTLGYSFPVAKLVQLADELPDSTEQSQTARWLVHDAPPEDAKELAAAIHLPPVTVANTTARTCQ